MRRSTFAPVLRVLALLLSLGSLVGCGGGGSVTGPAPEPPPPPPDGWSLVAGIPQDRASEVLLPEPEGLVVGGGNRLWRSTDGVQWTELPRLPEGVEVASLLQVEGRRFAGSFGSGVFELPPGAAAWRSRSDGLTDAARTVLSFARRGDQLYAGTSGAAVYRLALSGTSAWVPDRNGIPSQVSWNINALTVYQDRLIASGGGNGASYLQVLGAPGWREVFYDSDTGGEVRLIWDFLGRGPVLLGGGNRHLYRSVDAGETWQVVLSFSRLVSPLRWVENGSRIIALAVTANDTQFLQSTDEGLSWQSVLEPLPGVQGFQLALLGDRLYLAHQGGFWSTPVSRLP